MDTDGWKRIFTALPDTVLVWDAGGRIIRNNRSAGNSGDTVELPPPDQLAKAVRDRRAACVHGGDPTDPAPESIEMSCPKTDRRFQVTTTSLLDANGTYEGAVQVIRDVTPADREMHRRIHCEKRRAIERIAGGMAHEFNNILFPIMALAELTIMRLPSTSEAWHNLNKIYQSAARAGEIVRQMLAFSRVDPAAVADENAARIVHDAVKQISRGFSDTVSLQTEIQPDCGVVFVNAEKIRQAVSNLIVHAATGIAETGGRLVVSADRRRMESADAPAGLLPGDYVAVTIREFGGGDPNIPENRLFEPYPTKQSLTDGTGWLLAVAQEIVSRHAGAITIRAEASCETVYTIFLPRK
jgi:nitrogen-specific signal transduction histidine kinase